MGPYIDPDTGLLRNLVGCRTKVDLDSAEADLSSSRLAELLARPPQPTGDLDELMAIHRQLFQDVYPWAGRLRTIDMAKNIAGAAHFQAASAVPTGVGWVALQLRDADMLRGLERGPFIEKLSELYDALNYAHPFREGNGRTQRVFWTRIARDAGWELDWSRTTGAVNDDACRAAMEQSDLAPMLAMFESITRPVDHSESPGRSGSSRRLSFPSAPSAVTAARALVEGGPPAPLPRRRARGHRPPDARR
ncbi:cell filamentation protein [Rathayibacter sp. PhB127]|uniref:Fic/DOC family protein n=1 Tax=Rathayibacter sp. PhB127 TaxID=2485176 RepID=UPI000F4D0645|nr:Fic family protein [Rathayibacter sp. PhB127]ROS25401.1 cell filamentation protein [Rathayibacter sp. PhB127]